MNETFNRCIDRVECPECGYENSLSDLYSDLFGPEEATATCRNCDREYDVSFHVSISVTARSRTAQTSPTGTRSRTDAPDSASK
jgi:transcription elongation factor Elf1